MKHTKHAVITGAADGIGKALAQQCAAAGYAITGIDNDRERAAATQGDLQQAGAQAAFLFADLASEPDSARLLDELERLPAIDLLIHNAGISEVGPFARSSLAQQQAIISVNLLAPMLLTAGLLRRGKLARGCTLVFISSLSHFVGYPGAAGYAASKDGLAAYARSLSVALAGQDMHVLTVFPGPTRTAHARRYSPDNRREQRRMPPEHLAAQILQAIARRQTRLIPGTANRLFALSGRYLPGLVDGIMRKTLLEPLEKRTKEDTTHQS